jgi:hypothetical protein
LLWWDRAEPALRYESSEAADIADPIDPAEANEPTLANEAKEAALPTERTESWEQIERIEFSDQRDHTRGIVAPVVGATHSDTAERKSSGARDRMWEPDLVPVPRPEAVVIELDPDEAGMLISGLSDWGGPAYGSDALAVAMGFRDLDDLIEQAQRLMDDIQFRRPMTIRDWTRALVATEFAFASSVLGTGDEWTAIRAGHDVDWLRTLRRLQSKVHADPELLLTTPEPARGGADLACGHGQGPGLL